MRVVFYLRRSTNQELQADSLDVQENILRSYADKNGHAIVRVFRESASGRDAEGREQFTALIETVVNGRADFDAVLVRDVSRWGRFDNADEAAYYDFLCFRHAVKVIYVEESFGLDPSPYAALMKAMKRVQAAEFSREKSRIIRAGKRHGAERGFRVGAPPPYGMKRVLVRGDGEWIQDLPPKEHKLVSSVKTKLAPAADDSSGVVQKIFKLFTSGTFGYSEIARELNRAALPSPRGLKWSPVTVRYILTNEAYAGTAVFRAAGVGDGIRVTLAHQALIPAEVFTRAQLRAAEVSHGQAQTRRKQMTAARGALTRWGHLPADLLSNPIGPEIDDVISVAWKIDEVSANIISEEKRSLVAVLQPRFSVIDTGEMLLINGTLSIRFVVGFTRPDLVGEPLDFAIPRCPADLFVCVGVDAQLQPVNRFVGKAERVIGRRILRHPTRRSKRLPILHSLNAMIPRIQSLIHRTPVAEAVLLTRLQSCEEITFRGVGRDIGWNPTAVKRSYLVLRDRGEALPELKYERGRRDSTTCSGCGVTRSILPSYARSLRSDLCGTCSRKRSALGKLLATCPQCNAERHVWPSAARKMRNGLASLCHSCALEKGRLATLEKNRAHSEGRAKKYDLLHDIALLVVRLMSARSMEFKRPTLWSRERRVLATLRWYSTRDSTAHRLTLDCGDAFVEKCHRLPITAVSDGIAEAVLNRHRWISAGRDSRGDRLWVIRLGS